MNLLKNIFLLSALSCGVSNANTIPCNGFKIDFKNISHQNITIDGIHFVGGSISTTDPATLEVNKHLVFTVNQNIEDEVMMGEFLFHTTTEPFKELKLNFSLTNKTMLCEVSDISKQGTLDTNPHRVLGGVLLSITD